MLPIVERNGDTFSGAPSGSVCLAVNPDSNDCISRSSRGVRRYSIPGFREGELNDTPFPNGWAITEGNLSWSKDTVGGSSPGRKRLCVEIEEVDDAGAQSMTSPKRSFARWRRDVLDAPALVKEGRSADVTLCECERPLLSPCCLMPSGMERVFRNLRGPGCGPDVVCGFEVQVPFLNMCGKACTLMRERLLDREGVPLEDDSALDSSICCSASTAEAPGADIPR